MGRTGKWWAVDHAGIEPDMICTAKGIASGMPLSAVIAHAKVMDWKPGAHASTFGGNPVSIAAALATIDIARTRRTSPTPRAWANSSFGTRPAGASGTRSSATVRGKGLMIGIEIVRDQKTKEKAPELRNQVLQAAFHKGLLVLGAGENSLRLAPPLVIDEEQAEFALRTLDECISEVERSA